MRLPPGPLLPPMAGEEKGDQPIDKLRLFIIWYLSTEQDVSRAEWTQFEEALTATGADVTSLPYIRQ